MSTVGQSKIILLDGYPRNVSQARAFDPLVRESFLSSLSLRSSLLRRINVSW